MVSLFVQHYHLYIKTGKFVFENLGWFITTILNCWKHVQHLFVIKKKLLIDKKKAPLLALKERSIELNFTGHTSDHKVDAVILAGSLAPRPRIIVIYIDLNVNL